jgi:thiosulfate dehydrogenase [quinone] large subunit
MSGWALLPLRAFLGFTFCFAGLQKLANPNFFNANSPAGIQAQLIAATRLSPLHPLLGHLLHFSTLIGVLIALGELAIGLGTLLGLWVRIAAVAGAILSFSLFLTVSYHSSPYYTGADIVFLFAWIPLILAGSGGVLSFDAVIDSWTRREARLGPPAVVPVKFELIQQICGQYDRGACKQRAGALCDVGPCPFLAEHHESLLHRRPDDVDRRALVLGSVAVGTAAAVGLFGAGAAALLGRAIGGAKSPGGGTVTLAPKKPGAVTTTAPSSATSTTQTPATTAPTGGAPTATAPPVATTTAPKPAGTAIGAARDVPVGGAAQFQDPSSGDPGVVLQPSRGQFVAFDAICPHAGCTVGYSSAADLLVCPCHGSEFNPSNGAVETGPAQRGLSSIQIALGSDGQLYVDG